MRIQGRCRETEEEGGREERGEGRRDTAKTLKGKLESLEKMRDWGEDGNPSW